MKELTIETLPVEIKVIRVGGHKMTKAVWDQILWETPNLGSTFCVGELSPNENGIKERDGYRSFYIYCNKCACCKIGFICTKHIPLGWIYDAEKFYLLWIKDKTLYKDEITEQKGEGYYYSEFQVLNAFNPKIPHLFIAT